MNTAQPFIYSFLYQLSGYRMRSGIIILYVTLLTLSCKPCCMVEPYTGYSRSFYMETLSNNFACTQTWWSLCWCKAWWRGPGYLPLPEHGMMDVPWHRLRLASGDRWHESGCSHFFPTQPSVQSHLPQLHCPWPSLRRRREREKERDKKRIDCPPAPELTALQTYGWLQPCLCEWLQEN